MAHQNYLSTGAAFLAARGKSLHGREQHVLHGLRLGAQAMPVAAPSVVRNLRHGVQLVVSRWMVRGGRPRLSLFRLAEVAVLAACTVLFVASVGLAIDVFSAHAARTLPGWAVSLFAAITLLGSSAYCTLLAASAAIGPALLAAPARGPRVNAGLRVLGERGLYILVSLLGSGMVSLALKTLAGRARPQMLDDLGAFAFQGFGIGSQVTSFPSGHSTTVGALAMSLSLLVPRWRRVLFGVAALVGMSRVAVGAHYPSDVLAGMCVGVASAWGLACVFARRGIVFRLGTRQLLARGRGTIMPAIRALAKAGAQR